MRKYYQISFIFQDLLGSNLIFPYSLFQGILGKRNELTTFDDAVSKYKRNMKETNFS